MIEHPGDHSFVMLRVLRRKQPKQVSKQVILPANFKYVKCSHRKLPQPGPTTFNFMSTGLRPSFSPSAHGYQLHHQHSSEHNLSKRPTTSHTLAAPSPAPSTHDRTSWRSLVRDATRPHRKLPQPGPTTFNFRGSGGVFSLWKK